MAVYVKGNWGGRHPWGQRNPWGTPVPGNIPPYDPIPQQCYMTYKSQLLIATMPRIYKGALEQDTLLRQIMCCIGTSDNNIGGRL